MMIRLQPEKRLENTGRTEKSTISGSEKGAGLRSLRPVDRFNTVRHPSAIEARRLRY